MPRSGGGGNLCRHQAPPSGASHHLPRLTAGEEIHPCWKPGTNAVTARVLYGRRSNLAQHESFLRYRGFRWLIVAVVLCGAAIAAFWSTYAPGFRLKHSGGSWLGYTLGTSGSRLMLWL